VIVIPDFAQRIFYGLTKEELHAHRLDTELTKIGSRKVVWPEGQDSSSDGVFRARDRYRSYLLDDPSGFTRDGQLRIFLIDTSHNKIVAGQTQAFATPGDGGVQLASGAAPTQPAASTSASPANGSPAGASPDDFGIPSRIVEGNKLSVQLKGPDGAEYELLAGPPGMQVTKAGQLTWTPSKAHVGAHELKIRTKAGSNISFARPTCEVIDKDLVAQNGGSLAAVDRGDRLELDLDHYELTSDADYSSLVLLQGDRLRVLGAGGLTVIREQQLPQRYRKIATRGGDYIALMKEPNQLDLIDAKTAKVRKSIPIQRTGVRVLDVMDVAPHPQRPISFVTIKHDIELPRFRILIVDEETGKVEAPEDAIGTWVKVDPTGRYLYAGYMDIYQNGVSFHINPGWQLLETPKYGNVDWLISYELRGQRLKLQQLVAEAGGNGGGIVLSADGKRITYLSHVGTPMHSENLVGWNPKNLKSEPVNYVLKGRGAPSMLAFHPILPIVAVPGSGSAVLFHRETGAVLENKLMLTAHGLGEAKVEKLLVAPDGKSLVFACNDVSGRYLRRVGLRLSDNEVAALAKGIVKPAEASAADAGTGASSTNEVKNLAKADRADLDALKSPKKPEAASSKEIGRRYTNAVVVVHSDDGTGSGFVVGRRGYVLTCAHVVSDDSTVSISYQSEGNGTQKTTKTKAKLIRVDRERDLALLKIGPVGPMTPVILAGEGPPESGEAVTVIGNPGLGDEILTHTVTTGVISSPERVIEGQKFIQTSAAVNAGNSGGPVFDGQGQVVGLVVLKANLEATAFAVPVKELRKFLHDATEPAK
jgi:S1-C subfamily serine protease